jgi:iron complex transport system permease protein
LPRSCVVLGSAVGSLGWEPLWNQAEAASTIVWDIRLPRSLGAWLAGALLGLAGAVAQGLFRNPLADPLPDGQRHRRGVRRRRAAGGRGRGARHGLGLAGAPGPGRRGFVGAVLAVRVTLGLARGVQHTLRLLLAGVIVGVVFGALAALVMFWAPEVMRAMQAFLLGTTGFLGWDGTGLLALVFAIVLVRWRWPAAPRWTRWRSAKPRPLSLGIPLRRRARAAGGVIALATGAAVAQVGLVAFVGLVAPHLVRAAVQARRTAGCCRWPRWPAACCCWPPTCSRAGCWPRANCRWACSPRCSVAPTCCG